MSSNYEVIARFYDRFTQDVDYDLRADYISGLLQECEIGCKSVLDLACGTGSLTLRLAELGYDMIGVDNSEDMLSLARMKPQGEGVLWLCQEGEELDLYGDIDCAVCTLDSVNHILDFDELVRVFKRVSLFMNRGGRFIFDVNTVYKHSEILGDNCFVWEDDGIFCAWQNEYEQDEHIVNIQLDFFVERPDGYDRETQYVTERAYTRDEICRALELSGFELVAEYDDMSRSAPTQESERVFYVAKNVKE